jgi:prephenate dehydratase
MNFTKIICPGGKESQTGTAVKARYRGLNIGSCTNITEVESLLPLSDELYAVPIWNSHQGEIGLSEFIWNNIERSGIKIIDLWAQTIDFWLVVKTGPLTNYGKIASVGVAQTQCSKFLDSIESDTVGFNFPLTTIAFDAFKKGAEVDGVLVAPGQGEEEGYTVSEKQTANNFNFTSFVLLTASDSEYSWQGQASSWLTGVTLGNLSGEALDDDQASFFEEMFRESIELSDIPKLVFVFKRTDKVGLLFEGEPFTAGHYLTSEQIELEDIIVHEEVGELKKAYTEELATLLAHEHSGILSEDFIVHKGSKTFLFSCPALGIFTHGFDDKTVEPVVRFYIDKVFEFIDNGGEASDSQENFFKKHEKSWREQRSNFISFSVIT